MNLSLAELRAQQPEPQQQDQQLEQPRLKLKRRLEKGELAQQMAFS